MEWDGPDFGLWDETTQFSIWLTKDETNSFSVWTTDNKSGIWVGPNCQFFFTFSPFLSPLLSLHPQPPGLMHGHGARAPHLLRWCLLPHQARLAPPPQRPRPAPHSLVSLAATAAIAAAVDDEEERGGAMHGSDGAHLPHPQAEARLSLSHPLDLTSLAQ